MFRGGIVRYFEIVRENYELGLKRSGLVCDWDDKGLCVRNKFCLQFYVNYFWEIRYNFLIVLLFTAYPKNKVIIFGYNLRKRPYFVMPSIYDYQINVEIDEKSISRL